MDSIQEARNQNTSKERLAFLASQNKRLARTVAQNPAASAGLLATLSKQYRDDSLLQEFLVRNPNTPLDILFQVGKQFPAALASNPVLSLLLLEDPEVFHKIPNSTLNALLTLRNLSPELLVLFASSQDGSIREKVAAHTNTPKQVLEILLQDIGGLVRKAAVKNPKTPQKMLSLLRRAGSSNDLSRQISQEQSLQEEELRLLVSLGPWPRLLAVSHPELPKEELSRLAQDPIQEIRVSVAKNQNTPADALWQLSKNSEWYVISALAANPSSPPDLLENLSKQHWVLEQLAINPSSPEKLLSDIANHQSKRFRLALTYNKNLSKELVKTLLVDMEKEVRYSAGKHKNIPETFVALLNKAGAIEKLTECKTPQTSLSKEEFALLVETGGFARILAARHPRLPFDMYSGLARDPEMWIREAIAKKINLSLSLFEKLSDDRNFWVREALAQNPVLPYRFFNKLSNDKEDVVRWAIARNLRVPGKILHLLCNDKNERVKNTAMQRCGKK